MTRSPETMTRELFLTDLQGKGPPIMKQDSIVEDNMRERGRGKKGERQRRSAFLSTGKQTNSMVKIT